MVELLAEIKLQAVVNFTYMSIDEKSFPKLSYKLKVDLLML